MNFELESMCKKAELWGGGGIDWIDLAQGMDRWRAVVKAVMNLRVP
jgi:hypothetical protein